jgi:hypothetical protein
MTARRRLRWWLALLCLLCSMAVQAQTGCALNPKTVSISRTLGSANTDVVLLVTLWCGTATGSTRTISGSLSGPGATGTLTRSGGSETVGFSVFRNGGVVSTQPGTLPSNCNGMTPWSSAVAFSVTVGAGTYFSPVQRYLTMCVRLAGVTSSQAAGNYLASPTLAVTPYQAGAIIAGGIDGTQNISITGTVLGTCSIQSAPGNVTLNYPSRSSTDVVQTTTAGLLCNKGTSWSAALSPTNGNLRGVAYGLTLDGSSTSINGSSSGSTQTLTISVRAPAGQSGSNANCPGPCSTSHALTITY